MSEKSKARNALLDLGSALQTDYLWADAERYIMDTQTDDMGADNYVRIGELRALRAQNEAIRARVDRIYQEFR